MASTTLSLSFPEADIAAITFDDPESSANVLSRHVLDALERHLNELDERKDLAGLVFRSAKPGMFIAGADLREFTTWLDAPHAEIASYCRRGQQLFERLSCGGYVTVAAIDGMCVGGGAELAAWCDRRVLTNSERTGLGFPEVKLGIFPGWGGTARTPRMIGLSNAVELVTGGETIDPRAAALMGLANDVVTVQAGAGDVLLGAAVRIPPRSPPVGRADRDQRN
jgi:3-hydroxyacyl-CoA dehydrogenase / enoyl-CoA hydratase / 3-hydroxybutyryl-CoA epimerase / enoyl-CoA isomerase